ncbi:hypothetical protein D3C84_1213910 [compost metagenome]
MAYLIFSEFGERHVARVQRLAVGRKVIHMTMAYQVATTTMNGRCTHRASPFGLLIDSRANVIAESAENR